MNTGIGTGTGIGRSTGSPSASATSSSGAPPTTTSNNHPPKILSCTNCRRRKIKCNKTSPCLPCQTSRTECIFPTRARNPRPRQSAPKSRDAELLKRISHLESLVSKIDASKLVDKDSPGEEEPRSNEPSPAPGGGALSSYVRRGESEFAGVFFGRLDHSYASFIKRQETGSIYTSDGFWTRLSEEVDGLRQLIESPSDDEDEPTDSTASSPLAKYSSPAQFLFETKSSSLDIATLYPSIEHRDILYRIYNSNVHPVVKVVHRGITSTFIHASPELFDENTGRYKFTSLEACTFAMFLLAVTSLTPEECIQYLNEEREILVARYKAATEIALQESDFLNSVEIVTLQALVLYITAMRSHDRSRATWTFIGIAVRIAQALGLHRDGNGESLSVFDAEMRRRTWWTLVVLDARASEDRGSETLISKGSFNTRLPSNINDEDIFVDSKVPPVERVGYTEMTFPLITMNVSYACIQLNFVPPQSEDQILTFQEKEQIVKECIAKIETVYLMGIDPTKLGWITMVSRLLSLKLIEMIWQHDSSTGFFWFFQTYVPWHALAIALAELCVETSGPLADQAWQVVEHNFNKWSEYVADTKDGMIWRPVKNLLKRAKAARIQQQPSQELQLANLSPQTPNQLLPSADLGFRHLSMGTNNEFHYPLMTDEFNAMAQDSYASFGLNLSTPMDIPIDTVGVGSEVYSDTHWNEFISEVSTTVGDIAPDPNALWSLQGYFTGT
ncbi:multidrug resistance regulator 1 protein [Rutstroemia sp. NJR-2017a BBW]|nr:multidrug resistance regulator 1 protein [Rutstroemia sp. NJR-2017a BBW]